MHKSRVLAYSVFYRPIDLNFVHRSVSINQSIFICHKCDSCGQDSEAETLITALEKLKKYSID